ncbi:ATP phosphoribosyltransferase regulatory subunit [Methylomonas paludis]|uniref:ATP phosphoribosyltransferase regulatory subunit n=1 Tax=Methylomonas paludis TaxID=1173101 RepID=A0A975MQF0_9GAMM|nr:ATP phosphoribosyltransferase regulatory subunit [Methylomonas paludis]QWF72106.1 ATP phosphoribosyltransferase regulatory subunit [Methylomonas paludis]
MQKKDSWLLPEGIDEALPAQAKLIEGLRRKLLDTFACWGYDLVIPPFVDFLDSLLTGSGHDLDLQTFKLTDQISGKLLGVRADMTPQVARIDAHNLKHDWPTRLCYFGTVLHTLGDPLEKTRAPMQIGAELYGHTGIESDYEIISLMLETLALSGAEHVHLDLGHVGIYRTLIEAAGLAAEQETELFDVLQRKARSDLDELLRNLPIAEHYKQLFSVLPNLNGGREVLSKALTLLNAAEHPGISQALTDLQNVADHLQRNFPLLPISFDLAELRGYHYHTGMVFAAFIPSIGREIARGGRYDNIGKVFGRARAATGFSADLKVLVNQYKTSVEPQTSQIILAPHSTDTDLIQTVRDLRAGGNTVIQFLPNQSGAAKDLGCTAILEKQDHGWAVKPLA